MATVKETVKRKWLRWRSTYDGLPGIFILLPDHLRGKGNAEDSISLEQWDFDPEDKHRSTDLKTAENAAFANLPNRGTQRWMILNVHFQHQDGLTDHEVLSIINSGPTQILKNSLTTRMKQLVDGGWLENTGVTRMGDHGIMVEVRKITLKGLREFAGHDGVEIQMS